MSVDFERKHLTFSKIHAIVGHQNHQSNFNNFLHKPTVTIGMNLEEIPSWYSRNKDKAKQSAKEWQLRNPERYRELRRNWALEHRKSKRKAKSKLFEEVPIVELDPLEYQELYYKQDGKCGCCGSPNLGKRFKVNRHYLTKKVRGLVCSDCDFAMNYIKTSRNARYAANFMDLHDGVGAISKRPTTQSVLESSISPLESIG